MSTFSAPSKNRRLGRASPVLPRVGLLQCTFPGEGLHNLAYWIRWSRPDVVEAGTVMADIVVRSWQVLAELAPERVDATPKSPDSGPRLADAGQPTAA